MLAKRHIAIGATTVLCWAPFALQNAIPLFAQQPHPPALTAMEPGALRPGRKTELVLRGTLLANPQALWTSIPGLDSLPVTAGSDAAVSCQLELPAETPVGVYGLRLTTTAGVSNLKLLLVDDLPTKQETGRHRTLATALALEFGSALEGSCEPEQFKYFKFTAEPGQQFTVEVFARRLASPLDPVLRIIDSRGNELAYSDDEPGLRGDCRLAFQAPAAGDYFVELRDIRYFGGADYRYHLRFGQFPLASVVFPPVVRKGTTAEVMPCVTSGETLSPIKLAIPDEVPLKEFKFGAKFPAKESSFARLPAGSALLAVLASELPVTEEREPNGAAELATEVNLACGVNGRFAAECDQDWYQFSASAGDQLQVQSLTQSIGSPTEVVLKLFAADGTLLTCSNPSLAEESRLQHAFASDGQYRLLAEELHQRRGEEFVYHLEITRRTPGFSLTVKQVRANPPRHGVFTLQVSVNRTHYQGDIALSLSDVPAGCLLSDNTIPGGQNETRLKVQVPAEWNTGDLYWAKIAGRAVAVENAPLVVASLDSAIREELRNLAAVPVDLRTKLAIGVGPPFPQFLKLTLSSTTCVLPRLVGNASIVVKAERLHEFHDAIVLEPIGLPEGLMVKGTTIDKGRNEATIELSGGEALPEGKTPFQLKTQVDLRGQPQTIELPVVLQVTAPLRVTLEMAGPLPLEGKQKLTIKVERYGKENHPVPIKLVNLPEGVSAPPEIVIPAGVNSYDVELAAALTAKPGETKTLRAEATTRFEDQEITTSSPAAALVITDGKDQADASK